jgi:hypothetical protein
MTMDGIEAALAVDVIGPFLLTTPLRDRLEVARGRVIMLTGIASRLTLLTQHSRRSSGRRARR